MLGHKGRYQLAAWHPVEERWVLLKDTCTGTLGEGIFAASAVADAPGMECGLMVVDHEAQEWAARVQMDGEEVAVEYNEELVTIRRITNWN